MMEKQPLRLLPPIGWMAAAAMLAVGLAAGFGLRGLFEPVPPAAAATAPVTDGARAPGQGHIEGIDTARRGAVGPTAGSAAVPGPVPAALPSSAHEVAGVNGEKGEAAPSQTPAPTQVAAAAQAAGPVGSSKPGAVKANAMECNLTGSKEQIAAAFRDCVKLFDSTDRR
jgi:hypothetical protein